MGCLVGCGSKYKCGEVRSPISGHVLSPWIEISISGGGSKITVGNNSYPSGSNRAVISSFQYGFSNGMGMRIEIVDEEGASFKKFFDKILDNPKNAEDKYVIEAEWGWIPVGCDSGSMDKRKTTKKHKCLLLKAEVKYEETLKFVLEGTDLITFSLDASKHTKIYGSSDNPMKLKDAIRQMFTEANPSIKTVEFKKKNESGSEVEFKFKDEDKIKGQWKAENEAPLTAAMRWISEFRTEDDKGIVGAWDDTGGETKLVFWEDGQAACDENKPCAGSRIGTFAVNGSSCSPVIQFSPSIKWPIAVIGNTGSSTNSKTSASTSTPKKEDKKCDMQDENEYGQTIGTSTEFTPSDNAIAVYGKDKAAKEVTISGRANGRASATYTHTGCEAILVIQGDPTLDNPIALKFSYVGIVVINPFNLSGSLCPEWQALAGSQCNEVLSNQNWLVKGISHEMKQGSYTTTFNLWLAPSGATIVKDLPMGGSPTGYKKP